MLRTVILNDHSAAVVELPWPQLTSLTLGHVFPHQCVPILQQTPDLVHCDLCLFPVFDETDDLPDITLPRLESLTLKEQHKNATGIVGFLDSFIVSALRSLQITEELLGMNPISALTSFISKSGCELQEVHIIGERSTGQNAYRTAFPSIQRFSFDS
jgi:hypothetical protein